MSEVVSIFAGPSQSGASVDDYQRGQNDFLDIRN